MRRVFRFLLVLALAACREPAPRPVESTFTVGPATATIHVAASDARLAGTVRESTQRAMKRVQDSLDAHLPQSDISRLNRVGASARIQIARDSGRLLDLARHAAEQTRGAYDCTVAPVAYLWGLEGGPAPTNEPTADVIAATRVGQGAHNLVLFDHGAATLMQQQTKVSVNDLLDAYATDLAVVEMRDKEIANALVRIGRSTRVLGARDVAEAWQTELPDPFRTNAWMGRVSFDGLAALSWIAPYQPGLWVGTNQYSRVIDPRSGRPARGVALAAAAGPTASIAEVLARAAVALGEKNCARLLGEFPRYELLIIPDRAPLEIWATPGLRQAMILENGVTAIWQELARPEPVKGDAPKPVSTAPAPAGVTTEK